MFLVASFILCPVDITRRKFQTLLDFTLVGTLPAHALTDQAPVRGSFLNPEVLRLPRGAWFLLSHRTGGAASSEVVLGGGFLGGGGGGGGGSLSEYLYERWGGLKSRHDEKRGEPAAVPYPGVRPCKRGRRLYISPAGAGRRPCYMLYCTGLLF